MMSLCFRLLCCLGFLLLLSYERGAAESPCFLCNTQPCASELYLTCANGLQRDQRGCDICACRPAHQRLCSERLCKVLCHYLPHRLALCPACPCARLQRNEPGRMICYGATAEHVDAAITGQIDVTSSRVIQRNQKMCYTATTRRWRTVDGTCNNVHNYGAAFMPVARTLPPAYDDGRQTPRMRSMRGGKLPSARQVSREVHTDSGRLAADLTVMFMQFGQFLDHDVTSFPLPTGQNKTIRCCTEDGHRRIPAPHSDCFPIEISEDSHFSPRTCMEFVRSVPALDTNGSILLPRENINAVTSFVDGSAIYGSSEERMRELRDNNGTGMYLKISPGDFLPHDTRDSCVKRRSSDSCFLAGDERVNEQPALTALHTVFLRQHNRIATTLHGLLPRVGEEEIFQRSRAVVGAILQNIVYGAWLPLALGPVNMHRYGLKTGSPVAYNADVDGRITSVFSTAVFRFGHSMIPRSLTLGQESSPLRDLFNRPFVILDNLPQLVQGLIGGATGSGHHGRAQSVDRSFVDEVTNHLFQPQNQSSRGLDLVALNIQRGRDHGLPPYTRFREECGLSSVTSFNHPALGTSGRYLQKVYRDVQDVDIFTGGMVEAAQPPAIVGPTFACLLARQFHALKYGDRFYFEASHGPGGFSERLVKELRKATLAWVLCNTLPFHAVQRDVFRLAGFDNPVLSCEQILANGPDLTVLASHE